MLMKVKLLHQDAKLPTKTNEEDLGYDFYCVADKDFKMKEWPYNPKYFLLKPGQRHVFHTGISVEIPPEYGIILYDRSGLGSKGIHRLAGVIDSTYRGEIKVVLINLSDSDFIITEGDRIAQGITQVLIPTEFQVVDELNETERGKKGFGSSGR